MVKNPIRGPSYGVLQYIIKVSQKIKNNLGGWGGYLVRVCLQRTDLLYHLLLMAIIYLFYYFPLLHDHFSCRLVSL